MEKPETKIPSLQERLANVQRLRGVYKFNRATVAAGLPRGTIAYNDEASSYNIRRWADAIGDLNSRFRDSDYAKSTKYGRLVAQPTFLVGASYPVQCHEEFALDGDDLLISSAFDWLPIEDDWKTPFREFAPLPPTVAQ